MTYGEKITAAIQTVKRHQEWRKGADTPQISPKELTEALDIVIEAASRYEELLD